MATNKSQIRIGAVITKKEQGIRPVALVWRKTPDKFYSTHKREILDIVVALETWRSYLHWSKFTIRTIHIDFHLKKYFGSQKTL